VRTYSVGNLKAFGPNAEEQFETLTHSGSVRVERIVSRGHCSAPDFWYDQAEDEFVLLVSGAARLQFADGTLLELRPGDWVNIPARVRHRVDWTDETTFTVWLAVFSPANPQHD
jgi:cupin 2 domain-containing protein